MSRTHGFTLVELAIVLVLLGLLTGGILAGQSLIRAAELRAVSNDFAKYETALATFKDKYFGLPGDIANATAFWGKDTTNCNADSGTAGTPGTCNGNNSGSISDDSARPAELFRAWQQLGMAGLVDGSFTGIGPHLVAGTNGPRSKLSGAGYGFGGIPGNYPGDGTFFASRYNNMILIGADHSHQFPLGQVMKPEEAWNLDQKLDDGLPHLGRVMTLRFAVRPCPTSTNDAYNLSDGGKHCALIYKLSL